MFAGETLKVQLSLTCSTKRRVAFSGSMEVKKCSEQCSGAAVAMGRAAASEETRCEERMAGGLKVVQWPAQARGVCSDCYYYREKRV